MCGIAVLIVAPRSGSEAVLGLVLLGTALVISAVTLPVYVPRKRQRYTT
jgi:hypothetical protein